MKPLLLFIALLVTANCVHAVEEVKGYRKKDGTYVQGHKRSSPDGRQYDNFSSEGKTNPYTGKKGHQRNELSPPAHKKKRQHSTSKKK